MFMHAPLTQVSWHQGRRRGLDCVGQVPPYLPYFCQAETDEDLVSLNVYQEAGSLLLTHTDSKVAV